MAFDKEKMMPNIELTPEQEAFLNDPQNLEPIADMVRAQVDENTNLNRKLNRAQRRALEHKSGKGSKRYAASVREAALKLNYIELIQKLREMNEKKEKENSEDEGTTENN